jgi:hypothetical protein
MSHPEFSAENERDALAASARVNLQVHQHPVIPAKAGTQKATGFRPAPE